MSQQVTQICRYPVKGLRGEDRRSVRLATNEPMAHDRVLSVVAYQVDPATQRVLNPGHKLSIRHPALMPSFMSLSSRYDDESGQLCLESKAGSVARGTMDRLVPEHVFNQFLVRCIRLAPESDLVFRAIQLGKATSVISLINLATVRELAERVAGTAIDPRRFRSNIYLDGVEPWEEMSWDEIVIGGARLKIVEPTMRCDVTSYNVDTGARDMNILKLLKQGYGHPNLGVYARVVEGGAVAVDDRIEVISTREHAA